ncbi:hypothetical protein BU15DRAFT_59127 [Melanogaster broomeanus]|nr:hypothetical protein BU15DRAFT_59127 [Melanogaster broomeanus]
MNNDIDYFTLSPRGVQQGSQTLFLGMDTLNDTIRRRQTCFGEAWLKLQAIGFAQKAELPQDTDVLVSTSRNHSLSTSSHLDDPRREAIIPRVSTNADERTYVSTITTPYLDDAFYVDLLDGMHRGLISRSMNGDHATRLKVPNSSPAEVRRRIEGSVAVAMKDRQQNQRLRLPPSPVDDEDWEEVNGIMLALDGSLHWK